MVRNYRTLFNTSRDAIFLMRDDRLVDCNPATLKMFGCTREQIVGESLVRFSPPTQPGGRSSLEVFLEKIHGALTGKPQHFEWCHIRFDGTPFDAEVCLNMTAMSDEPYLLATVRDITTRKAAEREIAEQTALLRAWADTVPGIAFMYDATGTLVLWNQQFFELFGGTREEMVTQGFLHYIVPDDRVKARKMFDDLLLTGQTQSLELRVVPKTGICMPLVIRVSRFYKNGQPFIVGVAVDVTDRIKAEEETARQKEALRHLTRRLIQGYEDERRHIARELHDELGQSLTAVRTDAVYIANRMKDAEPDIHERAQAILKIAGRTYDVTHAIMKRLRPGVLDDLGLVDAVEDLIADWQHQHACIGFGLEIDGTFDDLGGETKIAIYRAVQECLTNVMRHSAATEVSIHLLRGPIRDDSGGADNTHVQLRVRDNGRGLSGTAREHMSKGFGLAGMRERVSGLNGTLVLNEPGGKGLEVEITIPLPKDMGLPGAAREDD